MEKIEIQAAQDTDASGAMGKPDKAGKATQFSTLAYDLAKERLNRNIHRKREFHVQLYERPKGRLLWFT